MRIIGYVPETYLLIINMVIAQPIKIKENVDLLPVDRSPKPYLFDLFEDTNDRLIARLLLPGIGCQLRIRGESSEDVARETWNAMWFAPLVGSICGCEAVSVFCANRSFEDLSKGDRIDVIDRRWIKHAYTDFTFIDPEPLDWIRANMVNAVHLMEERTFLNAIHCLNSYHSQLVEVGQLAVIWAGIEGLFDVQQELSFRLSVYIARFLPAADQSERRQTYERVRSLYGARSNAIHGTGAAKKDKQAVESSAAILRALIRECIIRGALPKIDELVP